MEKDNADQAENKHSLATLKQINAQNRLQAQAHWQTEVKQAKEFKDKLPYKNEIITK
jgi:hypothetical protein|tara:strand:- start:74 stop:244 length:171 start_codon:yes stop_codon:yes gene_type:complete